MLGIAILVLKYHNFVFRYFINVNIGVVPISNKTFKIRKSVQQAAINSYPVVGGFACSYYCQLLS